MRILIISDSHGRTDNIELIKKQIGKIDLILHCGDGASDFDYIKSYLGAPISGVTGNCDMFSQEPYSLNLNIEGKTVHIEHGNRIQFLPDSELLEYAAANGFDVLLYGHTHVQKLLEKNGRFVCNPGSISRPRDGFASYCILETDGKGGFRFMCERV